MKNNIEDKESKENPKNNKRFEFNIDWGNVLFWLMTTFFILLLGGRDNKK